jgi:hypothetical protein
MNNFSTDDHKTKEQLLTELTELRREVDRLRFLEARSQSGRGQYPGYDELERRVTENMDWL